ncbi:MAG: hypothetical protein ACRD2R_00345, partial [Terriglobales bacterium]
MKPMAEKRVVGMVLGLALAVAAGNYALLGTDVPGAAEAARNTARFSGLVFALALAAPALRLPATREGLVLAFVTAHTVHYAAVVVRGVVDTNSDLHRLQRGSLVVVAFGVLLLLVIAVTAGAHADVRRALQRFAVSVAWLLLVAA